jgi:hypothetical protein
MVSPEGVLVINKNLRFNDAFGGDPHMFRTKKLRLVALVSGQPVVTAIPERGRFEDVTIGNFVLSSDDDDESSQAPRSPRRNTIDSSGTSGGGALPLVRNMTKDFGALHPVFEDVLTEPFMRVCECVAEMCAKLGSSFLPVKANISDNVDKIRRQSAAKDGRITQLLEADLSAGKQKVEGRVCLSCLWLKRALDFIMVFMQAIVIDGQTTAFATDIAYKTTLQPWHGWTLSMTCKTAFRFVPDRDKFLEALKVKKGSENSPVLVDLRDFVNALSPIVESMDAWFDAHDLNFPDKV